MICSHCKKEIASDSKFCELCGSNVKIINSKLSDLLKKTSEDLLHPERVELQTKMKNGKSSVILLTLGIFFLLIGIFSDSNHDFYTLLRFYIFSMALYLSFLEYKSFNKEKLTNLSILWIVIAILFNPLLPIKLEDKSIWSAIDIILIGFSIYRLKKTYSRLSSLKLRGRIYDYKSRYGTTKGFDK
jgi:hypothetical protein